MTDIEAQVTGKVWKIVVQVGDAVQVGQPLMILESMKMEIPVNADAAGTLAEILVSEDDQVADGDVVARLETS